MLITNQRYAEGKVGDKEVKQYLAHILNEFLTPIRLRRQGYQKHPGFIDSLLITGKDKAREIASKTLTTVRKAMQIEY